MIDKRAQRLVRSHICKKAYQYRWDTLNVTELVTAGWDVNKVEEPTLVRAAWQECVTVMKDMMDHTDFSKEVWNEKMADLLEKSGISDKKKAKRVAKKTVTHFFKYLDKMGWF
jgi:hypothetical protein